MGKELLLTLEKNKSYGRLLKKMLIIEVIGEALYKTLVRKTSDRNLKTIYEKLALNEKDTAQSIEEELLRMGESGNFSTGSILFNLSSFLFNLLTASQLFRLLKTALKRSIYRKWFHQYRNHNLEFWNPLLNHENLQLELLKSLLT